MQSSLVQFRLVRRSLSAKLLASSALTPSLLSAYSPRHRVLLNNAGASNRLISSSGSKTRNSRHITSQDRRRDPRFWRIYYRRAMSAKSSDAAASEQPNTATGSAPARSSSHTASSPPAPSTSVLCWPILGLASSTDAPTATAAVIFLHGSGGGAEDFFHVLRQCASQHADLQHVKWVCPEAKPRPYSLIGGEELPVWFDRTSLDMSCREDDAGISLSCHELEEHVVKELERQGITRSRMIVAGFSQGGCLALHWVYGRRQVDEGGVTVSNDEKNDQFAGCLTSGSFLPHASSLLEPSKGHDGKPASIRSFPAHVASIPLLMLHGRDDAMIPPSMSLSTHDRFRSRTNLAHVQHVMFDRLDHGMDDRAMERLMKFVRERLPKK